MPRSLCLSPRPGWPSSRKRVFRVRRPSETSRATEFMGDKGGLQSSPAWPGPTNSTCVPEWGFSFLKKGCILLICKKAFHGQSLATQCGLWAGSLHLLGSLLEMQGPRPDPRPQESEPTVQKIPRGFLQALYCLRSKGLGWPWDVLGVKGGVSQLSPSPSLPTPLHKAASPYHPPPGLLDLFRVCVTLPAKGV